MRPPLPDAVATLHRKHYRALVAPLIRMLGGFEAAEDVVQDTFAQALETWSREGIPEQPLAWLRRVAKNRAVDRYRRRARWQDKEAALQAETETTFELELEALIDEAALRDDSLRLVFTCCHPSLSPDAQIGLTLRTVCGLTSEQVARAFLLATPTLQQRLVRARKKIDAAKIPYVVPNAEQLPMRLAAVLRTLYLVFNEGYGATDGESLVRRELCDEGIRLGRLVVDLMPGEPSPKGLLALMLLHHARRDARTDDAGDLVTLEDQDRSLWDRAAIDEALPLVEAALLGRPASSYAIEAAIAALHARAETPEQTDWRQITALYAILAADGNPVVQLNHAVAVAMAGNVAAGLAQLDALREALPRYHLLPAARADLLRREGRDHEAAKAYREALALVTQPVERRYLSRRLDALSRENSEKDHGPVDPPPPGSSGR
ncbi:MAG: RNA polymerase sigma factor [Sandaracinaceae bacterium]